MTFDPGTAAFAVVSHCQRGESHAAALTEEPDPVVAGRENVQSMFKLGDRDIDLSRNLRRLTSPNRIVSTVHQEGETVSHGRARVEANDHDANGLLGLSRSGARPILPLPQVHPGTLAEASVRARYAALTAVWLVARWSAAGEAIRAKFRVG